MATLMNKPAFAWKGKVHLPSEDWDPEGAPAVHNKTGRVAMTSQGFPHHVSSDMKHTVMVISVRQGLLWVCAVATQT